MKASVQISSGVLLLLFVVSTVFSTRAAFTAVAVVAPTVVGDTILRPTVAMDSSAGAQTYIFKVLKKQGHASYYADALRGKKTASGARYDPKKYTAAHKSLPFGTVVRVTNEANGKSVLVTINDRGPFTKNRDIDLSRQAFFDIARHQGYGSMKVTIEIAHDPTPTEAGKE